MIYITKNVNSIIIFLQILFVLFLVSPLEDLLQPPLVLRDSVFAVVSAILIQDDKLLMIKEAKDTCYGKWHLPAGKLRRNETLKVRGRFLISLSFLMS